MPYLEALLCFIWLSEHYLVEQMQTIMHYKCAFGLRRRVKRLFRKASHFTSTHSTSPSNYWAHKVFQPIEKASLFILPHELTGLRSLH